MEQHPFAALLPPALALAALVALAPRGSAQFVVTTNKTTYEAREPLVVGEKFVNASPRPIPYETIAADGTAASIHYLVQLVDLENNATSAPPFLVERNGVKLKAKSLHVYGVGSGFSGEVGPGRSSTLGGTLGFGIPFNLLVVPPAVTGVRMELVTETNQVLVLVPGERLALLSSGAYLLTALVDHVSLNGYAYASSSTGYLVAETFFDIASPKRAATGVSAPTAP